MSVLGSSVRTRSFLGASGDCADGWVGVDKHLGSYKFVLLEICGYLCCSVSGMFVLLETADVIRLFRSLSSAALLHCIISHQSGT